MGGRAYQMRQSPVIPSEVEGSRGGAANYATGFLDSAALRSE